MTSVAPADILPILRQFLKIYHYTGTTYRQSNTSYKELPFLEAMIHDVDTRQLLVLVASAVLIVISRRIFLCHGVSYSTAAVMLLERRAFVFFGLWFRPGVLFFIWRLRWRWMPFYVLGSALGMTTSRGVFWHFPTGAPYSHIPSSSAVNHFRHETV